MDSDEFKIEVEKFRARPKPLFVRKPWLYGVLLLTIIILTDRLAAYYGASIFPYVWRFLRSQEQMDRFFGGALIVSAMCAIYSYLGGMPYRPSFWRPAIMMTGIYMVYRWTL